VKTHLFFPGAGASAGNTKEREGTHELQQDLVSADILDDGPSSTGRQLGQELKVRTNDKSTPALSDFPEGSEIRARTRMAKIAKESARICPGALIAVMIMLVESGGLNFNQTRPTALCFRKPPLRKEELDRTFGRNVQTKVESFISYGAEASARHEGILSGTGRYPLCLLAARKFSSRRKLM
jgi:hypothetical protein